MRLFLTSVLAIALCIMSCSPATTDEQASADTLQGPPIDSVLSPNAVAKDEISSGHSPLDEIAIDDGDADPVFEDSLSKYFTPDQIVILKKAREQFNGIKTVQQMANYYPSTLLVVTEIVNKQIGEITPTETSGDDSPDASWKWFGDYYPGFYGSVDCSECEYDIKTTFGPLKEKAQQTPGNEDDMFFDLCEVAYGGSSSLIASISNSEGWYQLVGCDFCAASLLGNGKRLEILGRLEEASGARQYFGELMDDFQEAATSESYDKFFGMKKDILNELNTMLTSKILTAEQKARLTELRQKVQSGAVEVECGTKDCKWPEY